MNGTDSNFPFIANDILRQNLDEAFNHILTLLPFTESFSYNTPAKSAFRKTIIIYTASIVEALLFAVLDKNFSDEGVVEYYSTWQLTDEKVLHKINEKERIVGGTYKMKPGKTTKEKMNLGNIMIFLEEHNFLGSNLQKDIDKLRKLRNDQHIGTHKKVKNYNKKDLEFAFSVAKDVKIFTEKHLA